MLIIVINVNYSKRDRFDLVFVILEYLADSIFRGTAFFFT